MSADLTARIAADFAATGSTGAARRRALAALERAGLPGARDENWKYASLRGLERLRFAPAAAPAALPAGAALPAPISGFDRYVFLDGRFAPALSAPPGATVTPLGGAAAGEAAERAGDQRFALLNDAFAVDGARIMPARGTGARVELIFLACAAEADGASYPRIELQLAPDTELELIERHLSAGPGASFVSSLSEAELGHGARLTHYRLQGLSGASTLLDTLEARLAAGAAYRLNAISTGARAARSTQRVILDGERAAYSAALAALGDDTQVQDTFAQVEHRAPRSRSEQLFRGIAAGRARVACNSKVLVAAGAAGSDSQQSLRGLLAGPQAEIDVRPQLEIYTDEVRASHGATAGKLDENMLFYLLARGLAPEIAQRLLKWAFLGDACAHIAVPQLRQQIEAGLAEGLKDRSLEELL